MAEISRLSDSTRAAVEAAKSRFMTPESALLEALRLAQVEAGFLSREVLEEVADVMDLPLQVVYETASFYSMFRLKPQGRYPLEVCGNLSCALAGAFNLMAYLEQVLGIGVGQTTGDGLFSLNQVECLGSCGTAPVMQVGDTLHESLTPQKVDDILADLRRRAAEEPA